MKRESTRDKVMIASYIDTRFRKLPSVIRKALINIVFVSPSILYNVAKLTVNCINNYKYLLKAYYKLPVSNGLNTEPRDKKIIISLTTIPSRIEYVPYVLGSMLRQTVKPDMIILNLGHELFSDVSLPPLIKKFESVGVTIRYVPDLKPHTKYYYSMRDYPNDIIITIDDDSIYPLDFIENLYHSYLKHPHAISCYRAHLMLFDEEDRLLPYNEWISEYSELINTPSLKLFATGVGGVLYPPYCMHTEVYNKDMLLSLSPRADDVWLKIMQVMNSCPVIVVRSFIQVVGVANDITQKNALCISNVGLNENDVQIQNLLEKYNCYFGDDDTLLKRILNDICDDSIMGVDL